MAINPSASQTLSLNMKLLSNHDLGGFGGIGEGMGMSKTADGRRIMWLGHEGPPKNFTGVDSPYEAPENPEIRIDTTAMTADEAAEAIVARLIP